MSTSDTPTVPVSLPAALDGVTEQEQEQLQEDKTMNGQLESSSAQDTTRIVDGIEWFTIQRATGSAISPQFTEDEDCQCARCGSSCDFLRCGNCDDGEVEHAPWDGFGDPCFARCDWCHGTGGSYHCISGPEWCEAHPMPGREHIISTALRAEAWRD